jgi:hypothetical protein
MKLPDVPNVPKFIIKVLEPVILPLNAPFKVVLPVTAKLPVILAEPVNGKLDAFAANDAVVEKEAVVANDALVAIPTNEPLNEPVATIVSVLTPLNASIALVMCSA